VTGPVTFERQLRPAQHTTECARCDNPIVAGMNYVKVARYDGHRCGYRHIDCEFAAWHLAHPDLTLFQAVDAYNATLTAPQPR